MTEHHSDAPAGDGGFTLVETLIAITIFSLLSLLVVSTLQFGLQAWHRSDDISQRLDEFSHAEALLRQLIADARPQFISQPGGWGYIDFEGGPTSLRVIADPPASLDRAGPLVITLQAASEGDHTDLIISATAELSTDIDAPILTRRALLENVPQAAFSYFGTKSSGETAQWHQEWVRQTKPPDLVRIALTSADGDRWPTIIIRPRVDVDVSCTFDTLTRGCRGR
jgi:prepilin-type N-terminal cleavage/methylation domain-containing protein